MYFICLAELVLDLSRLRYGIYKAVNPHFLEWMVPTTATVISAWLQTAQYKGEQLTRATFGSALSDRLATERALVVPAADPACQAAAMVDVCFKTGQLHHTLLLSEALHADRTVKPFLED